MNITNYPGTWQEYVKRPDNLGLPISTVTRKYMRESEIFNSQLFEALQQNPFTLSTPQSTSGGSIKPTIQVVSPNCIQFVVDTTDYTNFGMEIEVSSDTNYTADWGNGDSSSGILSSGYTTVSYAYSDYGQQYTVNFCFDNAVNVTRLEFFGND